MFRLNHSSSMYKLLIVIAFVVSGFIGSIATDAEMSVVNARSSTQANVKFPLSIPIRPATAADVKAPRKGTNGVIQVSAGGQNTYTLKNDGTVSAMDNKGQTGIPIGLNKVVQLSAGYEHTLALKSDGTVVAWGANDYGQTTIPEGLNDVVQVAAGRFHSVAIKSDGTVVSWGGNNAGQTTVPIGLNNVVQTSTIWNTTVALKGDGTVVAWGNNSYGQMTIPRGLDNVVQVSAGIANTFALKSDGTLVVWGSPYFDLLKIPSGLKGVVQVSAGIANTFALKSDGTLVAWGYEDDGQTKIPNGLNNVVQVSTGMKNTTVLKNDGTALVIGGGPKEEEYTIDTKGSNASFISPEGIAFISYRSDWGVKELKEIYQLILRLPHLDELKSLHGVLAFSESNSKALGEYDEMGVMYLSGQWKTPGEYINVLSHEYGHHFTLNNTNMFSDSYIDYLHVRSQNEFYPVFNDYIMSEYDKLPNPEESYSWNLKEVLARDYQTLFALPVPTLEDAYNFKYLPAPEIYRDFWEKRSGLKKEGTIKMKVPTLTSFDIINNKYGPQYDIKFSSASDDLNNKIKYRVCIRNQTEILQDQASYYIYCTDPTEKNELIFTTKHTKSEEWDQEYDAYLQTLSVEERANAAFEEYPYEISEKDKIIDNTPVGKAAVTIYALYEPTNQLIWSTMYWYDFSDPNLPKPIVNQFYLKEKMKYIPVFINGIEQSFDTFPQNIDGSTLVPMRELFERLGLKVMWDNQTRTVTGTKEDKVVKLTIDNKVSFVDGKQVDLPVPPKVINEKTLVPLRFVAEALNAEVKWDAATSSVWIQMKQ